jgi:DNA-binding FrmR family transcriptional regulator
MHVKSPAAREQIANRLNRIEGQVRGVRRMLDEDRDCRDIVQQLAAIRSAVHQAGLEIMRTYAEQCLADPQDDMTQQEVIDYLVTSLGKWA